MGTPHLSDMPALSPGCGEHCAIAIVKSRFNRHITDRLHAHCVNTLNRYGVTGERLINVEVPGALEIPFAASVLAKSGKVDGIIALGCVLRGETFHFEIVSQESARGLMTVQIKSGIPVINGILTVDTEAQAEARIAQKGVDAALGAIELACWRQSIWSTVSDDITE